MAWDFNTLEEWDDRICQLAASKGLDWFPIMYEICDYFSMIGHMSYHGMPTHYGHWSYGKQFERTHTMYNLGMEGLPYELIINSEPAIAYLMKENPAYLQVLIMAHCVGHSDFFKNNRMFKKTRPGTVVGRMRSAKKRIQNYVEDHTIGIVEVEQVLDAAHALQFQTHRYGQNRSNKEELEQKYRKLIKEDSDNKYQQFDMDRIPLEPDYDLLGFIVEYADMPAWKKDVVEIVRDESKYFIPQIQTKIMNEGWASFWHYNLLHDLDLPEEWHLPFIKTHNAVVRPHIGGLNPYHLGFKLFQSIEEKYGLEECFIARESSHDVAFLRQYLTRELCEELGLFTYSDKGKKAGITIDEISDKDGWETVKTELMRSVGTNSIPVIYVEEEEDGMLVLRHEHDGRDLDLNHSEAVIGHVDVLWNKGAKLFTLIEEELWEI